MLKEFSAVMAILGLVVGSGFITGKEIVVFFSRFGGWSFITISVSCFVLYFLFKFILNNSGKIINKVGNSYFVIISNIILCTIFSGAMFGGINNLLIFDKKLLNFLIFSLILTFCLIIFVKGGKFFNKINIIFVPFMIFIFVVLLISKLNMPVGCRFSHGEFSLFYCLLYCILNVSNGCVVIADLGRGMTKTQKARVALISALVLSIILLCTNFVLLSHPEVLSDSMPLVSLFSYGGGKIISLLVFIGCLTTLFSTVYSASSCIRGVIKRDWINFTLSIMLPLLLSFWGFSNIVQYLYPLASVLGGVLLFQLFFIPPFKRRDKKIHCGSKQTKDENAGHNNV